MSARALIDAARSEGLSLAAAGDNLIVETDRDPPPELLAQLREHKGELLALLRPSPKDDPNERAAIVAEGAGVPRRWAEGYAMLCAMPPPPGFGPERWQRIIGATGHFLDRWGADAARLGWDMLDVFGVHDTAPVARFDCMGLVLLLDRCEVAAIDRDGADLLTEIGARQRFRRRSLPLGTVPLWELRR